MMIFLFLLVAIAAFAFYASSRPDSFTVSRSINIAAAPEKIFSQLNDFKAWSAWSPYERMDPAMNRTFSATTEGKGATYAWQGNGKVGAGNMLVTTSNAPSLLALDLNMLKPFSASNKVTFTLEPSGGETNVTWTMQGRSPFIAKAMGVFMDTDKMVGGQFEEGLANLKRVAEAAPA
jgi:uncharacterized protein YndB with AHSA1/START domain